MLRHLRRRSAAVLARAALAPRRYASSGPDGAIQLPLSTTERSLLEVRAGAAAVTVHGGAHGALAVDAAGPGRRALLDLARGGLSASPSRVALSVLGAPAGAAVEVTAPPSHVSYDIETAAGDIRVDAVKDANVDLRSASGDIHVGKHQGLVARLVSASGAVSGHLIAADLDVWGGSLGERHRVHHRSPRRPPAPGPCRLVRRKSDRVSR